MFYKHFTLPKTVICNQFSITAKQDIETSYLLDNLPQVFIFIFKF